MENYFTEEELSEIKSYNKKNLSDIPMSFQIYVDSLKELTDAAALQKRSAREQELLVREWIKKGDMMRRIWRFIDTIFDDSKIKCRSKTSSANMNIDETLASVIKMERKSIGRKLDLISYRQLLEYEYCEHGRNDDQTKEHYNSDTKFTILLYDSPASYVCRMDHTRTIDSPEEPDDLCNELLPILKAVYQSRLMMKSTSKLVKQKATDNDVNIDQYMSFLSSFTNEVSKRKRRRSNDSAEEKHYCD